MNIDDLKASTVHTPTRPINRYDENINLSMSGKCVNNFNGAIKQGAMNKSLFTSSMH